MTIRCTNLFSLPFSKPSAVFHSLPLPILSLLLIGATFMSSAHAEEPNNTFSERTILEPGVMTVSDELYSGEGLVPDTYIGAFDSFGNLSQTDDDSSPFGDGRASALFDVPVNLNNDIEFAVTGFGDNSFFGSHSEAGGYEAYIEVFDFSGGFVESFSVFGTLEPGAVDSYSFDDDNWFSGSYDVYIDNTNGNVVGGDVDFFTFTGLTPGAMYTAETVSPSSIDTILASFDEFGNETDFNDDFNNEDLLSQLQGTVPASGELTFAVSGYGDDFFEGVHTEQEAYDLQLTIEGGAVPGDFDNDGDVDSLDLTHPNVGWEARYGSDLSGQDFLEWQKSYGTGTLNAATIPEPSSLGLLVAALAMALKIRK